MKRRKKNNKKIIILFLIVIVIIIGVLGFILLEKKPLQTDNNLLKTIKSHYSTTVKTNKEASLYILEDNKYKEIGLVSKDIWLSLEKINITKDTLYFKLKDLNSYYIKYGDVLPTDEVESNDRYLNYIPFNQNIITKEKTSFYDEEDNLVYKINDSYSLPIIIKDTDKYAVIISNKLLYIHETDVDDIKDNHNTDKKNSSGVGVLNYHAFYDENNKTEKANCTTSICHSKKQFKTHLDYLKENNILTITMRELELYIDSKIQLPKSVVITIDDGPKTEHAINMLTEYKMNATIFLVTSWFNPKDYPKTDYIELHSHSHNMHDGGKCPGGQGGAIKCLAEDKIQADLKQSREALNGSTVFCYPFYEYNDYSIKMLKKAGFTMAFIGESTTGDNLVHVGSDKFKLKRFVIVTYTTMRDLDNYFKGIK